MAVDLTQGPVYLYIGEVGDNGEVASGTIMVSDTMVVIPLPGAAGMGLAGLGMIAIRRRRA